MLKKMADMYGSIQTAPFQILLYTLIHKQAITSSILYRYGQGFDSRQRQDIFLFSTASRPALGPTQWVPEAVSPVVKRQWREADHSPPSSAEVKNVKNSYITSCSKYAETVFIACFQGHLIAKTSFITPVSSCMQP
jgi:hypothetical protein